MMEGRKMRRRIIAIIILGLMFQACKAQKDLYKVSGIIAKDEYSYCEIFTSDKKLGKFPTRPKKTIVGKTMFLSADLIGWAMISY
jgi:hypothetical protein